MKKANLSSFHHEFIHEKYVPQSYSKTKEFLIHGSAARAAKNVTFDDE